MPLTCEEVRLPFGVSLAISLLLCLSYSCGGGACFVGGRDSTACRAPRWRYPMSATQIERRRCKLNLLNREKRKCSRRKVNWRQWPNTHTHTHTHTHTYTHVHTYTHTHTHTYTHVHTHTHTQEIVSRTKKCSDKVFQKKRTVSK